MTAGDDGLLRRADDLLGQLTMNEKIGMLHQCSPGVPRLGIAAFHTGTEALHGAAWNGIATVFPQAVALGATWDPELAAAVGAAVGDEVRALHRRDPSVSLNVWAPVVNLLRDPRWGRNEEGYSEDPLLTARMAVAYCAGLRGDHPVYWRTAPLLKHFFAYNNEGGRDTTSSVVRPRVLHEYDLPPFRAPIEAGVAVGVMPSYNLVNGRPNHVSPLINRCLRSWTADELIVCSDAHAPSNLVQTERYFADHAASHAAAIKAGLDSFTDNGTDPGPTTARIRKALRHGLITPADVDRAVRRLLFTRLRLGEFDPEDDPYAAISPSVLDCAAHRELARRVAGQAVVLLRNEGGLLPLAAGPGAPATEDSRDPVTGAPVAETSPRPRLAVAGGPVAETSPRPRLAVAGGPAAETSPRLRLAVIGPLASEVYEDWYSGTMPYRTSVADGLRDALAGCGGAVTAVEPGVDRVALSVTTYVGQVGLGEFDVSDWGSGSAGGCVVTLRSARSGRYLTVTETGAVVAEAERPNGWVVRETFAVEAAPGGPSAPVPGGPPAGYGGIVLLRSTATQRYVTFDFSSGTLAASADAAGAQPLRWTVVRDGAAAAAQAAAGADISVIVVGNHPLINGRETQDRTTLELPPGQQRVIRAALGANPRTVLVIMSSYPFALGPAAGQVPAIVWTGHGGQEAGSGLADVLLGRRSPSGRLPQTWYASDADLPDLLDYDIIASGRTYLYFAGPVLYPFGHGLSYTTFGYSRLRLQASEPGDITVTVDVTNTGSRQGTEVVQVYARAVAPRRRQPERALAGFARVTLAPGESQTVPVLVPAASLGYWDVAAHRMTVDPGDYEIMVGSSSADIAATARLTVPGPEPAPRPVLGAEIAAADFDEYRSITLVDATREDGDAVAPSGAGPGWIVFRDCDLGFLAAAGSVTLRFAREQPGAARAELRLGDPLTGDLLAEFTVTSTGDRYAWTEVTAPLSVPASSPSAGDLCLVLHGEQRVASLCVPGPR